jgi:hypothetical protein
MKFNISKVDCNHDIWVLKGGNCYPYPTYPLGACMEWEFVTFHGWPPYKKFYSIVILGANWGNYVKKI